MTRFFPVLEQVPTFSSDDDDEFAAEDFENWVGAAFCQIQRCVDFLSYNRRVFYLALIPKL